MLQDKHVVLAVVRLVAALSTCDKMDNKWWDDYKGEEMVLWDDPNRDTIGHKLMGHIKKWCNEKPVRVESKFTWVVVALAPPNAMGLAPHHFSGPHELRDGTSISLLYLRCIVLVMRAKSQGICYQCSKISTFNPILLAGGG